MIKILKPACAGRPKFQEGITLVEIAVSLLIMSMLSMILMANFPKILNDFALSRVTYKLAQNIRKTQDLGLSGLRIVDSAGEPISRARGYGIFVYIEPSTPTTKYILYADLSNSGQDDGSKNYDGIVGSYVFCAEVSSPGSDCVLELLDVSDEDNEVYIKELINVNQNYVSINFRPPDFVNIDTKCTVKEFCEHDPASEVGIVLGLLSDNTVSRTVWVNTSGLVRVQ